MHDLDFEICDGTTFKDVCKDIIVRSNTKKDQIDILYSDLRRHIKDMTSALNIVPQLKTLLDTGIKNDEQLIKLVAIFQKLQSTKLEVSDGGFGILSDEDKEVLLKEVENDVQNIKKELNLPIK